jgi:hypothetical protein
LPLRVPIDYFHILRHYFHGGRWAPWLFIILTYYYYCHYYY